MMRPERPFLTARWTELLLLNFPVPMEAIAELAPPGTEPDLCSRARHTSASSASNFATPVSAAAPGPATRTFPEINLRYYVRRIVDGEVRRGVVFVREIVPRHAIALMANRLFHENYICRPIRSEIKRRPHRVCLAQPLASWQAHPINLALEHPRRARRRVLFTSHPRTHSKNSLSSITGATPVAATASRANTAWPTTHGASHPPMM